MTRTNRPNLIITRAGKNSLHQEWISDPSAQNFDLLVAAYDDTIIPREAGSHVLYRHIPGPKISGWMQLFKDEAGLLDRYEQIALIDDDIRARAVDLSRCFDVGREFGLKLWQPSLSWDSYATYGATLTNRSFRLRFVNFVEMMCPFFESSFLRRVLPTFDLGLESGIDLVWCSIADDRDKAFAIVDEVSVKHTRSVGDQKSMNGFTDRTYNTDVETCLDLFSARWPSCIASGGVSKSGRIVAQQLDVAVRTWLQVLAVLDAPEGSRKYRFRSVLDHIRHQWTRKPIYIPNVREELLKLTMEPGLENTVVTGPSIHDRIESPGSSDGEFLEAIPSSQVHGARRAEPFVLPSRIPHGDD